MKTLNQTNWIIFDDIVLDDAVGFFSAKAMDDFVDHVTSNEQRIKDNITTTNELIASTLPTQPMP